MAAERLLCELALERAGSVVGAAALLGVSRLRQALETATDRLVDAVQPIVALPPAPFEPMRDAQWKTIEAMVESTRGGSAAGKPGPDQCNPQREHGEAECPQCHVLGLTNAAYNANVA